MWLLETSVMQPAHLVFLDGAAQTCSPLLSVLSSKAPPPPAAKHPPLKHMHPPVSLRSSWLSAHLGAALPNSLKILALAQSCFLIIFLCSSTVPSDFNIHVRNSSNALALGPAHTSADLVPPTLSFPMVELHSSVSIRPDHTATVYPKHPMLQSLPSHPQPDFPLLHLWYTDIGSTLTLKLCNRWLPWPGRCPLSHDLTVSQPH